MDIIITLIIGGIIGWLASMIMKTDAQMGLIANIVVGIVGSFLGFWIAGQLGFAENQAIVRWLIAIGGAVLLIAILKALNSLQVIPPRASVSRSLRRLNGGRERAPRALPVRRLQLLRRSTAPFQSLQSPYRSVGSEQHLLLPLP